MKNRILWFCLVVVAFSSCGDPDKGKAEAPKSAAPILRYDISEAYSGKDSDSKSIVAPPGPTLPQALIAIDLPVEYINKRKYYVAEGDLFLTEEDAYMYLNYRNIRDTKSFYSLNQPFLIIYWNPAKGDNLIANPLNIRFGIVKESFKNNLTEYNLIREAMIKATKDWERVCNVRFVYEESKDGSLKSDKTPNGFSFIVQKSQNKNRTWYAKAPMPHQDEDRQLIVSDRFFKSVYAIDGMMRHEIGHILGFLHEHTSSSAPADCPDESNDINAKPLTFYDKYSVMHYLCEKSGHGTHALEISDQDSLAARCVYAFPDMADACGNIQFAGK